MTTADKTESTRPTHKASFASYAKAFIRSASNRSSNKEQNAAVQPSSAQNSKKSATSAEAAHGEKSKQTASVNSSSASSPSPAAAAPTQNSTGPRQNQHSANNNTHESNGSSHRKAHTSQNSISSANGSQKRQNSHNKGKNSDENTGKEKDSASKTAQSASSQQNSRSSHASGERTQKSTNNSFPANTKPSMAQQIVMAQQQAQLNMANSAPNQGKVEKVVPPQQNLQQANSAASEAKPAPKQDNSSHAAKQESVKTAPGPNVRVPSPNKDVADNKAVNTNLPAKPPLRGPIDPASIPIVPQPQPVPMPMPMPVNGGPMPNVVPNPYQPQAPRHPQQYANLPPAQYPMYYDQMNTTHPYMPAQFPYAQPLMQLQRPMYPQPMPNAGMPYPQYPAPNAGIPRMYAPQTIPGSEVEPPIINVQKAMKSDAERGPGAKSHSRPPSNAAINNNNYGPAENLPAASHAKREKKVIAIINPETHEQLKFKAQSHRSEASADAPQPETPAEPQHIPVADKPTLDQSKAPITNASPPKVAVAPTTPAKPAVVTQAPPPTVAKTTVLTEEEKKRRQQEVRDQIRRRIEENKRQSVLLSSKPDTVENSSETPKSAPVQQSSEDKAEVKVPQKDIKTEAPSVKEKTEEPKEPKQTEKPSEDVIKAPLEKVEPKAAKESQVSNDSKEKVEVEKSPEQQSESATENKATASAGSDSQSNASAKSPETSEISDSKATESLENALYVTDVKKLEYPEGIHKSKLAIESQDSSCIRYEKEFLLQFQNFCKFKPCENWAKIIQESIGNSLDANRRSGNSRSGEGRSRTGGGVSSGSMHSFYFEMGKFGANAKPGSNVGFNSNFKDEFSKSSHGLNSQSSKKSRSTNTSRRGNDSKRGHEDQTAPEPPKPVIPENPNRWKPRSMTQNDVGPDGQLVPEAVQRKVKAALNKMTPQNFDRLSDQILEIAMQSRNEQDGRTLRQVIELTFEKATDEANYSNMYAQFCLKMMEKTDNSIKDEQILGKDGEPVCGGLLFRKYLLSRCQEQFEKGWKRSVTNEESKEEQDANQIELLSEDYYKAAAAKRRGLGLVQFVGELFKFGMLTRRIMLECITRLLGNIDEPEEEEVESLCCLMRTVGQILDEDPKTVQAMQAFTDRMTVLRHSEKLSSRIRFMIQDILELRAEKWRQKDAEKGPKTISEIHEDAEKAREASALAAMAGQNRGSYRSHKTDSSDRGRSSMGGRQSSTSSLDGWSKNSSRFGQLRLDKQQGGPHTPSALIQNMMRSHSGSRQSGGNALSKTSSSNKSASASQPATNMYDILDSHHDAANDGDSSNPVDGGKS